MPEPLRRLLAALAGLAAAVLFLSIAAAAGLVMHG